MNIAKHIEIARQHLKTGNAQSYAQMMSGNIRAAMSARAANAYRKAIAEDAAEHLFDGLRTACPTARKIAA